MFYYHQWNFANRIMAFSYVCNCFSFFWALYRVLLTKSSSKSRFYPYEFVHFICKIHWRFQQKSIPSLIPKCKDRRTDRKEFVCLGRPLILFYWYYYQEKQCKTVNLKVGMDVNKTIANLSVKVKFPGEINKWMILYSWNKWFRSCHFSMLILLKASQLKGVIHIDPISLHVLWSFT